LKFLNESKVPEYQLTDRLKIANKNQEQTAINEVSESTSWWRRKTATTIM